jgi:hypothetical protein
MTLEMARCHVKDKIMREHHRDMFGVRTIKAIISGKHCQDHQGHQKWQALGRSGLANINDNHNAIYGNNDTGYGEKAGHKDQAYQSQ